MSALDPKRAVATHDVKHVDPINRVVERLNPRLVQSGHQAHNHWIATRYVDQDENIG